MTSIEDLRKLAGTVAVDAEDKAGLEFIVAFFERMDAQTKQLERIGDQLIKLTSEVQTLVRRR